MVCCFYLPPEVAIHDVLKVMHTTSEQTLKWCLFGSINFPLSSTSEANIQPTILLPTHQTLTQNSAYVHYTKENIILQ